MSMILTACTSSYLATAVPEAAPPEDKYVGTTRWVTPKRKVSLCDAPHKIGEIVARHCETLPANSSVTIERVVYETTSLGIQLNNGYAVRDGKGRTGYIDSMDAIYLNSEAEKKSSDHETSECNRRGGVSIGMTKAQVMASCWGKPQKINETITARSRHEQWVYGGSYVYLDDGIVRSIQTSH